MSVGSSERSERQRLGRGLALLLSVVVLALAGPACTTEQTRVELSEVGVPPGGTVAAVLRVGEGDEAQIVAVGAESLFVRGLDDPGWSTFEGRWPRRLQSAGLELFDGVWAGMERGQYQASDYIASSQGVVWLVAVPAANQPTRLLYSRDQGRSWLRAALPANLDETLRVSRSDTAPRLRLLSPDDGHIYLTDGRGLWRWTQDAEEEFSAQGWQRISLAGVDFEGGESQEELLPATLRHYMPATEDRAYELLTVLRDRLLIFRREAEAEEWMLTSSVAAIDRALATSPDQQELYLLDRARLYRNSSIGELWEPVEVVRHSLEPQGNSAMLLRADEDAVAGYVLLIGGDRGTIWRSEDAGVTWEETRERDPDGRGITHLTAGDREDVVWAGTRGQGVLRSTDGGMSWESVNQGLNGAHTYAVGFDARGQMLVGTDAGLFRRIVSAGEERWQQVHDRATSAVMVNERSDQLISGTLGGSVLVHDLNGQVRSSEAAPLGRADDVIFRPVHLDGVELPPAAIVALAARPGGQQLHAWSHQHGPLLSNDGGESWRRARLGEAFRSALEGSVVSAVVPDRDGRTYMVSRPLNPNRPTQLWRSGDGGETWQSLYSYMENEEESPLRLAQIPWRETTTLVMVHGGRVALSRDQAQSWVTVNGPWAAGEITGLGFDGEEMLLISDLPHASELIRVRRPEEPGAAIVRHPLIWPGNAGLRADRPLDLQVRQRGMALNEAGRVFAGEVPRRRTSLPESMGVLVTVTLVIILTSLSFAFLKTRRYR
ncbi:hypothetical protein FRC98_11040 [Lujinxingia vulgaris]|uniref:Uncharacterized protein n=1 Tax=Lujinxingia vulgaris TaxID=2600176 RepID=A0A5C6XGK9_9DELT|nr:sialidase family protein [Lujinxingia vulgaris]TXD37258.1 hypothetical protein FRC98_11040 [Lujinxingia vulgaris]